MKCRAHDREYCGDCSGVPEEPVQVIPASVVRLYPYIDPGSWEKLSEHRYRAPHPNTGSSVIVVTLFGETIGRGVSTAASEQAAFADLIEHAAVTAAHRISCQERTPIVRPYTGAHATHNVVGCCWWCGGLPQQHDESSAASVAAAR